MPNTLLEKIRTCPLAAKVSAAVLGLLALWQVALQLGLFDGKQPIRWVRDCYVRLSKCGDMSEGDCQYAADRDPRGKWEVPSCNIVSRK